MRRISFALALVGAVAAGCSGGAGNPDSNNAKKGVGGSLFTLSVRGETQVVVAGTTYMLPAGGVVTSTPAGIDCGIDGTSAPHTACAFKFTYDPVNAVTVNAVNNGGTGVHAFAGACSGQAACSVLITSDQFVAVRFASNTTGLGAHPNFSDGAVHGDEYNKWAANNPLAYHCTDCHGAQGQGQGTAPSCSQCHTAPPLPPLSGVAANKKTGLVATIDAINVTSPLTVTFHLANNSGNPVDLSGADGKNTPLGPAGNPSTGNTNTTIGFAVGYFTVATNSYGQPVASQNTIYYAPGNPSMYSMVKINDPANAAKGLLKATTTPGQYTYQFPSTSQISAAQLGNTHTLFMFASRQEDVSGGPCTAPGTGVNPFSSCPPSADNTKGYTAVNVINNFDPSTGNAVAATRDVVKKENCWKCHDGFQPKGLVSAAFHSGNKVDGRICNVCHNPARTSNPWANSNQFVHRIHAYAESEMPHYACVDTQTALGTNWSPLGLTSVGVPAYAGGGQAAVTPSSLTDASVCNTTVFASPFKPTIKSLAFHELGVEMTYPQDIRNCDECHGGAAQGAQFNTNATPSACNSCHGNNLMYWFGSQTAINSEMGGSAAYFVPGCVAGNEADCIVKAHPKLAVSPPDPQGCLLQSGMQPVGCNGNTNAAYLANAGQVPFGADAWSYHISSVGLDVNGHPQMTFGLLKNGTPVPFDYCTNAGAAQTDKLVLFNSTFGGPSLYFAYAVTQDGIPTPADFNGSASAYLPAVCSEGHVALTGTGTKASTTQVATISGPDGSDEYTVTLVSTANLSSAGISMLTGGVGYTYNPSSTPPLTETNLGQYVETDYAISTIGTSYIYGNKGAAVTVKTGGLVVPIKNVTQVATGFTGRRVIVDNAKCDNCHARLGAKPTFHAGQRNDVPSCSFCHRPNQGSGGWSANASTFVHAIHGAEKRTVKFAWEGGCNIGSTFRATVQPAAGVYWQYGDCIDNSSASYDVTKITAPRFYYPEVTYPGLLRCSECHTDGFFAQTEAAASNLGWTTYAQGTSAYGVNANTAYPYITPTTVYGQGFAFNANAWATTSAPILAPGASIQAVGTTLVGSPIAAACFSCHDDTATVTHMTANGGHVYEARSTAQVNLASEACLGCHGTGKVFDIAQFHP